MSSRLRNLNSSKISFFAFQDIITAVSGILILVTLILATGLEQKREANSQDADVKLEQQLQETLRQQMEVDAQNHRLQELLTTAETAPALEKLNADISRLHVRLSEERKNKAALNEQLGRSQSAIEARDDSLGLTPIKTSIQQIIQEVESIKNKNAKAREETVELERQVTLSQSRIMKLRQREGQIWLIPDKSATTKEPILVTVSKYGAIIECFDRPDARQELNTSNAINRFETYLRNVNNLNQYLVFYVRPSGISLFQELLTIARDKNIEVGFDALEEERQIHFSTPPVVDESMSPTNARAETRNPAVTNVATSQNDSVPVANPQKTGKTQPATTSSPQPVKRWWQKLLEWLGLG